MAVYVTNSAELSSIANAIRKKAKLNNPIAYPNGFVNAIKDIQASNINNVVFYDYDGSIIESYSADEFLELTNMPANPSHTGLIAQGWNWSLNDAKTFVTARPNDQLNIGQMYITESGNTEIDVIMQEGRLEPILTICVNGTITVDWGDETTPDTVTGTSLSTRKAVPHTYAQAGAYTISISAEGNNRYCFYSSTVYTLLRKNTSNNENTVYTNAIQHIRIGSNVEIDSYAFYTCYSLSSITIPNSIMSINGNAFQHCYSLVSITIPSGITSITTNLFNSCYSLSSITIPNSITSIGSSAFSSCYSLSNITIPDSVTSIGSSVFSSCYSLSNIKIPDSVTNIETTAFYQCYALSNITIPDNITSIGSSAFNSCHSLSSITIPDSVTNIGNSAFRYCYSLANITLPNDVTSIGSEMFNSCKSLTNFTIPNDVTSIGNYAFYSCFSLANIIIPDGVTSIGNYAFQNCYSLTIITIPSDVTSIGNDAFSNCYGMKEYHILPTTPPTAGTTIFNYISSDCIIYVPKGHLTDYQTATNWSTYASYMQEEST